MSPLAKRTEMDLKDATQGNIYVVFIFIASLQLRRTTLGNPAFVMSQRVLIPGVWIGGSSPSLESSTKHMEGSASVADGCKQRAN